MIPRALKTLGLSFALPLAIYCGLSFAMPYYWPVAFVCAMFVGLVFLAGHDSIKGALLTMLWYIPVLFMFLAFVSARLHITGFVFTDHAQ